MRECVFRGENLGNDTADCSFFRSTSITVCLASGERRRTGDEHRPKRLKNIALKETLIAGRCIKGKRSAIRERVSVVIFHIARIAERRTHTHTMLGCSLKRIWMSDVFIYGRQDTAELSTHEPNKNVYWRIVNIY